MPKKKYIYMHYAKKKKKTLSKDARIVRKNIKNNNIMT